MHVYLSEVEVDPCPNVAINDDWAKRRYWDTVVLAVARTHKKTSK